MSEHSRQIGIAVITHSAAHLLPQSLPPLLALPERPRVLVVNSSSHDGTVEAARELGAQTLVVPRREFNHGTTRELARHELGTPIVVMMTPDAIPSDTRLLECLTRPLLEGQAEVSYARQIPHEGSGFFETFPRSFNYPEASHIRGLADAEMFGAYLYFCSNACAAWSNAALNRVGGFAPALTQEDANAAAKILQAGGRIAYVADAVVRHSHRYGLRQEFQRNFDMGYERSMYSAQFAAANDERRGRMYADQMLQELKRSQPWLVPYGVMVLAAKYAGYKVGTRGRRLPRALACRLSGQDYYWTSLHAPADGSANDSPATDASRMT